MIDVYIMSDVQMRSCRLSKATSGTACFVYVQDRGLRDGMEAQGFLDRFT